VHRTLPGQLRVFAFPAALAELAMAAGTSGVDVLAAFEVLRRRRQRQGQHQRACAQRQPARRHDPV
jgi:hypothetical protein